MAVAVMPDDSFILGPVPPAGGTAKGVIHGQQAMRIAFADGVVLEEVLKHGSDLKISFGKSMRLLYGDQAMEVLSAPETHRHEIYKRGGGSSGILDFVGTFSHNLEVRQSQEDSSPDESLLKLQKEYELHNDQKSSTTLADSFSLPPAVSARRFGPLKKAQHLKKSQKKLSGSRSSSTTPTLKAGRSPLPSSSEGTSATNAQSQQILDALRVPILHLLALGPASEHSVAAKTKAPEELCARVIQKVAKKTSSGRHWELTDDAYLNLDVWDFPYASQQDREKAIQNARDAFTRLRLDKKRPECRLILPPEEREKASVTVADASSQQPKSLAAPRSLPSVKSAAASPRSPQGAINSEKTPPEDTRLAVPASKSTKSTQKGGKIARIIGKKAAPTKPKGPIGRPPKVPKAAKPPAQRAPAAKASNRYKSAEIIVDSDSDADMLDASSTPPKQATPVPKAKSPSVSVSQPHSSKQSSAASSDVEATGLSRLTAKRSQAPTDAKSPSKKPRTSTPSASPAPSVTNGIGKIRPNPAKSALSKESAMISARSASNSPPKPSPLGSSPPINASDDDVSNSSSPSSLTSNTGTSTPGRSPLDGLGPRAAGAKPRYMPGLKRKTGIHSDPERVARAPTSGTIPTRQRGPLDSNTIELARKFKAEYSRYERLYKEAQATTDTRRKRERIEQVLSLHQDLESLKLKIVAAAH